MTPPQRPQDPSRGESGVGQVREYVAAHIQCILIDSVPAGTPLLPLVAEADKRADILMTRLAPLIEAAELMRVASGRQGQDALAMWDRALDALKETP